MGHGAGAGPLSPLHPDSPSSMHTSSKPPASSLPQASDSLSLLTFIFQSWAMGPKALLCRLPAVCSWTCNLTTLGLSFSSVKQGFVMECLYHWVVGGTCLCLAHGKWWIMLAFLLMSVSSLGRLVKHIPAGLCGKTSWCHTLCVCVWFIPCRLAPTLYPLDRHPV